MNNKPITAQERKNRSIAILVSQGVPYIEHLPFRYETEEVTPRDKKEVIERAVCSFASIMCALSISKGEYSQEDRVYAEDFLSEKYNVLELLTPMEQQVIAGTISEAGAMNATWKYESLWVLLWALGIVEELSFPNEICDCDLIMDTMGEFEGLDDFMAHTTLRPHRRNLTSLRLALSLPLDNSKCSYIRFRLSRFRRRYRNGTPCRFRMVVLQRTRERQPY